MAEAASPPVARPWQRSLARLRSRWARPHGLLLRADQAWDGGAPPSRLTAALPVASFQAWCDRHPGSAAALWLSNHLLHDLACEPGLPLDGAQAVLDHARPLLMHFHGDGAAAWPLAPWSAGGRHGVSALHHAAAAPEALLATARAAGVRLVSVRPWWSLCLARSMAVQPALADQPRALLLVIEDRLVTVLTLEGGALAHVGQRWLATPTAAALAGLATSLRSPSTVPCLAVGYGLDADSAAGVTALGFWNRPQPQAAWLHPVEDGA